MIAIRYTQSLDSNHAIFIYFPYPLPRLSVSIMVVKINYQHTSVTIMSIKILMRYAPFRFQGE